MEGLLWWCMSAKVGNGLRRLRLEADLTQEELAHRLGVTRQTVIAIENGRYLPSIGLALRISRFFGRPVEEIFFLTTDDLGGVRQDG